MADRGEGIAAMDGGQVMGRISCMVERLGMEVVNGKLNK